MTRLENTKRKTDAEIKAGTYYRCFGDVQLASLLSRVSGLVSKNGTELEKLISLFAESYKYENTRY